MKILSISLSALLILGSAYGMNDPIRSSRSENAYKSFPYSDDWGDILFYNQGEPYYEFTNFYRAPIQLDGQEWRTSEHYFQAQKFPNNPGIREYIRTKCKSARDAFNASKADRNKHALMPPDEWNAIKWGVMYRAVKAKFKQHPDLKKLLLETGDRVLVENAPPDAYWGVGINPKTGKAGFNNLGIILMKVRDRLRKKEQKLQEQSVLPEEKETEETLSKNELTHVIKNEQPQSFIASIKEKMLIFEKKIEHLCKKVKNLYHRVPQGT